MKTAIVAGAIANKPHNGGEAWVRLSWARGMQKLGWRVHFVEQVGAADADAVRYFKQVTRDFGLVADASLISDDGKPISGSPPPQSADVLLNISGHLRVPALLERIRGQKVYIDIDPGYTQIWHEQDLAPIGEHDFYYTIGVNIGLPACPIPTGGIAWRHVLQPIVLEDWPAMPRPSDGEMKFTTVAAWRGSFGSVTYDGSTYGQKVHEFRKVIALPKRSPVHAFEIALQIHEGDAKDRCALESSGWRIVSPRSVAATPQDFRRYVQSSAAEFSVAQGIYVQTNSGWFSDRTVRYLASGRPAVVQATGPLGFPVGEGVLTFHTIDQAAAAVETVAREYDRHASAARRLAEDHFDSHKVLTKLLNEIGVSP
jgi:hypothetical protein